VFEDAIDNITTKVDLLKYCHEHNIRVSKHLSQALPKHFTVIF